VLLARLSLAHSLAVLVRVKPHVGEDVLRLLALALPHLVVVVGRRRLEVLEHPQVVLCHALHLPPPEVHVQAANRGLLQARLRVRSLIDLSHRGKKASILCLNLCKPLIILHPLFQVRLDHLRDSLGSGGISQFDQMR